MFIFLTFIVVFIIIILSSLFMVNQQTFSVVERFGKFNRIAGPGLRIKIPFVDRIVGELNLRIRELSEQIQVKSKDNAFMVIPIKVQFKVLTNKSYEAFYSLEDVRQQIMSYVINIARSKATEMDMQELFQSKGSIEETVKQELNETFTNYGYEVINVLVDDPMPSKDLVMAFNKVIASKRDKEAAENEAEAKRVRMVGGAKAEAESLEIKAGAYVTQRDIIAKGMKDFFKNDNDFVSFLERIDWRDAIRDAADGKGSVVVIPADMKIGDDIGKIAALNKV